MRVSKRKCSVEGCERKYCAKGYCNTHYTHWRRHGTPHCENLNWKPAPDRFLARVKKTDGGCWEWTGSKDRDGYGHIQIDGKTNRAHRYSWELNHGPIPAGMLVCHACNNPSCVKPEHLYLGTPEDNMRDMVAEGRHRPRGNLHSLNGASHGN
jgi:hypothetical protein